MSVKHKVGLSLLLLLGAAFVIQAFATGGKPAAEYREREILPEEFSAAEKFSSEMASFARERNARKFAARCLDVKAKSTAISWRNMCKFARDKSKLVKIISFLKEPERCRLRLESDSGLVGTIVCRREADGNLKFLSFHYVNPAEAE